MSEPSWHLPILYDANTPVWRPLFDRALRAAMVLAVEWSSLSLIEDSPRYVKIATLVIAILVLAVLESRYFLMAKGRWYFPSFIASLLVIYGGIIVYAFIVYPSPHREIVIHDKPISDESAKAPSQVPVSPPIDLSSGQQKNLFISIVKVFSDLRDQQSELSAIANELAKAQVNQSASNPILYYVPPCRIIVSSMKDNESFANLIETIAQSQGCKAENAAPPPPPPRPTDADEPLPKPIIIPGPLPYIVVRYPKSEDIRNLPEPPYPMAIYMHPVPYPMANHMHPVPSQEINEKTAKFREQIADKLLAALQGCGLDARRSHKAEGSPGWAVDKWTIYIDLGSVQICR